MASAHPTNAAASPSPSELENTVPDTPQPLLTLEQRILQTEKDMMWIKTALNTLLRTQVPSGFGETTPVGFSSPISGVQQSAPSTPAPKRGEGILPTPTTESLRKPAVTPPHEPSHVQRSEPSGPATEISTKKVDLPLYEGNSPDDWLFRLEKCFGMNRVDESEKLEQALTCLTGSAIT